MSADLHASSSRATLALDLAQRVPQPLDVYEIAAVIEASGITDDVARSDYGVGDVFALAERIFPLVKRTAVRWLELSPSEEPRCAIETRQMAVLEASGRGLLALVPLASLMAMLQGLAYVGWGMPSLLALSLGVSSAMLLTGGPIFAVGRRAAVYRGFGHWGYARRFCSVAFGVTFLACVLLDAAAVGAAAAAGAFTAGERAVFGVALAAAALVWLLMAGLALAGALLRSLGGLAAGLAVGIPATLALGDALGIGVGYGACIATLVAGWLTVYTLEKVPPLTGPAPGLLVLESAPYIVFGSAFGVMLLEPHLLGWFGAGMSGMPALRTLELSLLLALPPLLLVSGMSDRIVRSFWASAERRQRFEGPAGFRRSTTFFVRRQLTHYTYVLATMSALLVVAVEGAVALGFSSVSQLVFLPGVGAFLLIGVGQLGAMLMLGLGLLAQPVMALLAGIAVVAAAGAPVAAFDFRLAAPAFLVGAAAFAALSLRACLRLRGEADYDYAKAF